MGCLSIPPEVASSKVKALSVDMSRSKTLVSCTCMVESMPTLVNSPHLDYELSRPLLCSVYRAGDRIPTCPEFDNHWCSCLDLTSCEEDRCSHSGWLYECHSTNLKGVAAPWSVDGGLHGRDNCSPHHKSSTTWRQ